MDRLRAEALEHLILRQVVLDFINDGCRAGESEIRSEISIMETNLAKVDLTIEDHLKKTSQTRAELENEIAWRIAWKRYLDSKLTDDTLSRYFQNNRRIFDGTEMHVAQILFDDRETADQQLMQAQDVRSQITEGKISWDDAVVKYSCATESKKNSGDIGWIRFAEPMPEAFNEAAFELDPGQISQGVRTRFGVHLIKCIEIKPGKMGPRDAAAQVRQHATRALFDRIAQQHRNQVTIVYTDNWPNLQKLQAEPNK
jgi:parvulin-like peptidyl-prolyl isomerase